MTVPPISQYPHSVTFTTLPDMPNNFYSIAVPADSYYSGTVIINGSLTTLNWTPIRDTNGVITGYGYNTTVYGSSTISHSHANGRIYVSAYGFSLGGGYGYPAGILLQPINCVPIFIFNSTLYYATEGDNEAMIFIQKQKINSSINVIQVSSKDFNETVIFASGETIKAVSLPIPDDHYTGSTEYINLTLNSETDEETCAETTIVIKDNDGELMLF
ncbi:PREDICTED: uncharacterized protein LOC109587695 [Amphimedon queenslandica]|uniref:IgGFc-binding protein N-terminal domain-containing protein n=1 Tax=Amphimedon queenslandica TaxID=400682 RepID=A0A1X7THZ6_AMPQE|nr:PREDICTED: uncharacterized protein LOC109587695 [Amphimedon queenslandica]|eukprot:XP_019859475.1 PREDICTED: uncharacterized protein LOC109587695 [Amphimedon queenslandica]